MLAILLALSSSAGWGTADFLGGLSAKRVPILVVAAVSQLVGLGVTLLFVLVAMRGPDDAAALWIGALGGVCGAVGLSALYQGLAVGRMGLVAPIAALSGLVPVTVGLVVQGDRPQAVQIVGMVLAIGGVVLAARALDPDLDRRARSTGVGLAVIAAIALGSMVVALDAGGDHDPVWTIVAVRLSSCALLWAVVASRRPSFAAVPANARPIVWAGVLDNLANLLFVLATTRGLLSLVSVLGSLYPVVTVVLARVVLSERLARWQLVGVAGALTGVALISLG